MVDKVLTALNAYHKDLQFTFELEDAGVLPFLDMKLIRNGTDIQTDWYTKPTNRGRLLSFKSAHPLSLKLNTAEGLVRRIFTLSSYEFWDKNVNIARELLTKNNFPRTLADKMIIKVKAQVASERSDVSSAVNHISSVDPPIYKGVTYVRGLSEKLNAAVFSKIDRLKPAFRSKNTVGFKHFTKLKERVDTQDRSNVIYSIPCKYCDKKYIGMTTQKVKARINGHKSTVRNQSTDSSALALHATTENHEMDFQHVQVVGAECNWKRLLTLEMITIKKHEATTMNHRTDTAQLSHIYTALIHDR